VLELKIEGEFQKMSLVPCPECSSQVSSSALMCLQCGFPISKSKGLYAAIFLNDPQLVEDMIQLGADVNGSDENGRTPLMLAASNGCDEIVEMLKNAGANAEFTKAEDESTSIPSPDFDQDPITEPIEPLRILLADPKTELMDNSAENTLPFASNEAAEVLLELLSAEEDEEEVVVVKAETKTELEPTQKPQQVFIPLRKQETGMEVDGSICLQCGGAIGPEDIKCSNCQALIARRYCSHCSRLIPDHSSVCPLCGKNVQEHFSYSKVRRTKILIGTATAAAVVFLIIVFIWQQSFSQPNTSGEDVKGSKQVTHAIPSMEKDAKPVAKIEREIRSEKIKSEIPVTQTPRPRQKTKQLPTEVIVEPKSIDIEAGNLAPRSPTMSASTQRALELNNHQRVLRGRFLNSKGYTLIKAGRPSEAIPLLEQSLRSFPKGTRDVTYAYALFNLGVAWRMAGRPDIAIPILEERIKINNQREVVERELHAARRQARESGLAKNEF
jgi:hypothetical protein